MFKIQFTIIIQIMSTFYKIMKYRHLFTSLKTIFLFHYLHFKLIQIEIGLVNFL